MEIIQLSGTSPTSAVAQAIGGEAVQRAKQAAHLGNRLPPA